MAGMGLGRKEKEGACAFGTCPAFPLPSRNKHPFRLQP